MPVPAVWRAQPVVLDHNSEEEPRHDVSPHQGLVEAGYIVRRLAVVFRQPHKQDYTDEPHEDRDRHGDDEEDGHGATGDGAACRPAAVLSVEHRGPVPQCDYIELLKALDDACAEDPRADRGAALIAEVGREEDAAGRSAGSIDARGQRLDDVATAVGDDEGRDSNKEESESIEKPGQG